MSRTILELHPLAPLLLRDGRPFASGGEESRAQSLPLPLPHTLAGFVRTQLGQQQGWNWRNDAEFHRHLQTLHSIPVSSVVQRDEQFMFPAPHNAVMGPAGKVYRAQPATLASGEGTDAPDGLAPLLLQGAPESFKPQGGYHYWPQDTVREWLLGHTPAQVEPISGPPLDERTHVAMDSGTGAGKEGQLFTVSYRSFEERTAGQYHRWSLRIKTDVGGALARVGHLGGERRPVTLTDKGIRREWPNLSEFGALQGILLDPAQQQLCFVLTSPALFAGGWRPGWLSLTPEEARAHDGSGLPSGIRELMQGGAKLVGAAVGRRVPVSGWNLRANQPKAVRWAVPAGSVYFLQVGQDFDRQTFLNAWLRPLSDELSDRRDGFGCALWGVWN